MIAQPDSHLLDDETEIRTARRRSLRIAIGGALALFCFGAALGAGRAALEDDPASTAALAVAAGFALAALAALVWTWRALRSVGAEPEARSVTSARKMLYWCAGIGAGVGLLMSVGADTADGLQPFSDSPLSPVVAAALLVVLGVVVPYITWRWHRTIDEHEAQNYRTASLIALYTYFFASIVWWLGARGGFVPQADGKAIFWLTMLVWTAAWAWRKYR